MPARQLNCSISRRRFLGGMPDSTSKTTHQETQRSARCCVAFSTSAISTERWPKSQRFGGPARWLYDRFQAVWGGLPYPRHRGTIPVGQPAPIATLNFQPGDFVRVKSYEEILATLDTNNKNRGMRFDAELMPYCGGTYRVRARVERFIDEKTGYMKRMKTPAVILEGVILPGAATAITACFVRELSFLGGAKSGWSAFQTTHSGKRARGIATV